MFNYTVVKEHFERLDAVLKEHGIPWENMYNMDKKGIQLGGGRKSNGRKFFFSQSDRQQYQIKGGGLELITVIECVYADGTSLVPGFIFAGSTIDREATEVNPRIR
ncbi:hypothetical protein BDR04DRAFT_1011127 [Suillus decipiens]|nr:hypothetical protein BDR04DRAFT_1011127 [Suillus decipiens]